MQAVAEQEQPAVRSRRRAPGAFPNEIAAQEIELAPALRDTDLQGLFDEQMARAAVAQRLVIAGHDERVDAVLREAVVERDRAIVEMEQKERERALRRRATCELAVEA